MILRRYYKDNNDPVEEDIKTNTEHTPSNKELKALLDEKRIGYDKKANKETLIKLLEGAE